MKEVGITIQFLGFSHILKTRCNRVDLQQRLLQICSKPTEHLNIVRLHGPCSVGTGESCLVLSEEWNSGCLSSCSGSLRPLVELCVDPAGFSG